jgi:hypothetical protein
MFHVTNFSQFTVSKRQKSQPSNNVILYPFRIGRIVKIHHWHQLSTIFRYYSGGQSNVNINFCLYLSHEAMSACNARDS